ncbi:acetyltransferase [Pseudaestuariivita atlantica]|uniref:Acetyltransferase n=1 Tax=Pseudaestuariivita atlantica TaxID=1317121 RepID=A0A0L1JNV1_9RHOB|nr:acetyltransferase [Pseudaestuariivita atlantica]
MTIRPARSGDYPAIDRLISPVFAAGETYAVDPGMTGAAAVGYWFSGGRRVFVAEDGGVLGTYYIRPNGEGHAAHVCNCGYITGAEARGRGIATAMLLHSQDEARRLGYTAMQFNFVLATNVKAVALWEKHGFDTVGRLPGAYMHPNAGATDALVMFKTLTKD